MRAVVWVLLVAIALALCGCCGFFNLVGVRALADASPQVVTFHLGAGSPATAVPSPSPFPTLTPEPAAVAVEVVDVYPTVDPCRVNILSDACRERLGIQPLTVVVNNVVPYELYGSDLTYCYDVDPKNIVWTAEMKQVTAVGFAAWEPAGLTFREVPYSPFWQECLILVTAWSDWTNEALGSASSVGPLPSGQSYIWSNTYHMPHNTVVVAHEVGHLLGLQHTQGGIMNPTIILSAWPTPADYLAVRAYWFGEEE
jgi:hypothetical protein